MKACDRRGFDALVGNPPFLGGRRISSVLGDAYKDWLISLHEESSSNADLVAHFFRRAFTLNRAGGTFGLLATNTIAQGDTRATGLRYICKAGGIIYEATKRYKWPGGAAVVVSIVHVQRQPCATQGRTLDGKRVERISAFLFHQGGDDDPAKLESNANKSFQGSIVLGMGFTFDDSNPEASPISVMSQLLARDPRNQERIFPYLGGEEFNASPTQAHARYVINFGELSEAEARCWPDLMGILEAKVRTDRMRRSAEIRRWPWWQFWRVRRELVEATQGSDRVLAVARTSKHLGFGLVPSCQVFSENLVIFPGGRDLFPVLQSRIHEVWIRFTSSTLEDRQGYRPSDCFETFPFPVGVGSSIALRDAGIAYYEFRATLMLNNNEGLTDTYNRFHDPEERSQGILELRRLHESMDRAVLDAYGWLDLRPTCTFLLEFDDDETEDGNDRARRKRPWRYRWQDELRDEVLARLLALNAERAAEEKLLGEEAKLEVRPFALLTAARKRPGSRKRDAGPKLPGVE